jgi:hypothetical protein
MATLDHLVLSSGRSLNARLERAEHLLAELASRPLAPLLIDRSLIGTLSIGSVAGRDHIEVTVTPVQPDDK